MPMDRTSTSTSPAASTSAANAVVGPTSGELPKGIQFSSDIKGVPLTVERLPQEVVAGMANAYQLSQVGWSAPVTFQPDGSAVDSELAVIDATNRQIRLNVRGFTGGVTVSPIEMKRR